MIMAMMAIMMTMTIAITMMMMMMMSTKDMMVTMMQMDGGSDDGGDGDCNHDCGDREFLVYGLETMVCDTVSAPVVNRKFV